MELMIDDQSMTSSTNTSGIMLEIHLIGRSYILLIMKLRTKVPSKLSAKLHLRMSMVEMSSQLN